MMKRATHSTLTVSDVAFVLDVLQQMQNLSPTADAEAIGVLRARAFAAATTLRIQSGIEHVIEHVIVPIMEEA